MTTEMMQKMEGVGELTTASNYAKTHYKEKSIVKDRLLKK